MQLVWTTVMLSWISTTYDIFAINSNSSETNVKGIMSHRILIAEDNTTNLKILLLTLEGRGYEIEYVTDGEAAWDLLKQAPEPFSVVILDWMMPKMSGLEVMAKMQSEEQFKHIPVIIQTARAQRRDIEEGMKHGAFRYLTKPFDEDDLIKTLDEAIAKYNKKTD